MESVIDVNLSHLLWVVGVATAIIGIKAYLGRDPFAEIESQSNDALRLLAEEIIITTAANEVSKYRRDPMRHGFYWSSFPELFRLLKKQFLANKTTYANLRQFRYYLSNIAIAKGLRDTLDLIQLLIGLLTSALKEADIHEDIDIHVHRVIDGILSYIR